MKSLEATASPPARRRGRASLEAACFCLARALLAAGLLALAALAPSGAAGAAESRLTGVVLRVSDGDTLWLQVDPKATAVRARSGRRVKLRLVGLDAPESCQAHGDHATRALADRVQGRRVTALRRATDDYGRALVTLWLGDEDVGAWLVREGHAWSSRDRGKPGPYAREEHEARVAQRGLFLHAEPQEPRSFRREHGPCERASRSVVLR